MHGGGVSKWVFHLKIQPFCIMLVYNSICHLKKSQDIMQISRTSSTKTILFLVNELIFDTSAQKRIVFQAAWMTIQTVLIKGVI